MTRPLSEMQREALISLHRGHHFGVDARTERGLIIRGYVYVRPTLMKSGKYWALPHLTATGRAVAAELDAAEKRSAGARQMRGGFMLIEGGINA